MEESIYPWHTENWEDLQRMMDKLPHALLFYGPTGTGIETFAESFAKSMLCENRPSGGQPCASCQSCHWFDQYAHPDYRQILPETLEIARGIQNADKTASTDEEPATGKTSREPSRKIGIDKIRSLADFINISTHRGGLRIISVYPAEAMTSESSNALLKMLEEPPAGTLFILVTNHLDALLPTIVSRCSKLAFPMPETSVALGWLKEKGIDDAGDWLSGQGGAPVAALAEAQHGTREEMTVLLNELATPNDTELLKTAGKTPESSDGRSGDMAPALALRFAVTPPDRQSALLPPLPACAGRHGEKSRYRPAAEPAQKSQRSQENRRSSACTTTRA